MYFGTHLPKRRERRLKQPRLCSFDGVSISWVCSSTNHISKLLLTIDDRGGGLFSQKKKKISCEAWGEAKWTVGLIQSRRLTLANLYSECQKSKIPGLILGWEAHDFERVDRGKEGKRVKEIERRTEETEWEVVEEVEHCDSGRRGGGGGGGVNTKIRKRKKERLEQHKEICANSLNSLISIELASLLLPAPPYYRCTCNSILLPLSWKAWANGIVKTSFS